MALGTSALTRRDVSCVIAVLDLGGSKPVVGPVREGCCGGARGGRNGEELSRRGAALAAVLGTVFVVAGEVEVDESNQVGGGNSVAFLSLSFCLPFLPNLTNCSRAWIFARGRVSLPPSTRDEGVPGVLGWLTPDRSLVERLRRADEGVALAMIVPQGLNEGEGDEWSQLARLSRVGRDPLPLRPGRDTQHHVVAKLELEHSGHHSQIDRLSNWRRPTRRRFKLAPLQRSRHAHSR